MSSISLGKSDIILNSEAGTPRELFLQLEAKFVSQGYTKEGYAKSMEKRESEINTYMENSVAIPHGSRDDVGTLVLKTGILMVTLKEPMVWNQEGDKVSLVFAIASQDDEHISLLSSIASIFGDEDKVKLILSAKNEEEALEMMKVSDSVSRPEVKKLKNAPIIVGISACPTGVAHTYMAQEALEKGGHELGFLVHIETQGSGGTKNAIPKDLLRKADAVVLATDIGVQKDRFIGKKLLQTGTKNAIHEPKNVLKSSLNAPTFESLENSNTKEAHQADSFHQGIGAELYKHLMSGVSHMLPFVVAGGLLIAIAFAVGGIHAGDVKGSLGSYLMQIGGDSAFALMVPFLAAYIAYSIADRPGLTPGAVAGLLAVHIGAGFLGGIVGGFLAGYIAKMLKSFIRLPKSLDALMPMVIIPLISTAIVGLLMLYILGEPIAYITATLKDFLQGLSTGRALILGIIIGLMMGVDLGGPVNKAAYTFSVGLLGEGVTQPIAMAMAAGMVPPLAVAVTRYIAPWAFTRPEKQGAIAAGLLGLSFISEGAIPYTAAQPTRMIPANMLGGAVAGGLVAFFGCALHAPHGGIFVVLIPNAIDKPLYYVLAIALGVLAQSLFMAVFRKRVS